MSGTAVSQWAMDHTPQNTAKDIATQNGCPTVDFVTMVKCLQKLPPESVIRVSFNYYFQKKKHSTVDNLKILSRLSQFNINVCL